MAFGAGLTRGALLPYASNNRDLATSRGALSRDRSEGARDWPCGSRRAASRPGIWHYRIQEERRRCAGAVARANYRREPRAGSMNEQANELTSAARGVP